MKNKLNKINNINILEKKINNIINNNFSKEEIKNMHDFIIGENDQDLLNRYFKGSVSNLKKEEAIKKSILLNDKTFNDPFLKVITSNLYYNSILNSDLHFSKLGNIRSSIWFIENEIKKNKGNKEKINKLLDVSINEENKLDLLMNGEISKEEYTYYDNINKNYKKSNILFNKTYHEIGKNIFKLNNILKNFYRDNIFESIKENIDLETIKKDKNIEIIGNNNIFKFNLNMFDDYFKAKNYFSTSFDYRKEDFLSGGFDNKMYLNKKGYYKINNFEGNNPKIFKKNDDLFIYLDGKGYKGKDIINDDEILEGYNKSRTKIKDLYEGMIKIDLSKNIVIKKENKIYAFGEITNKNFLLVIE